MHHFHKFIFAPLLALACSAPVEEEELEQRPEEEELEQTPIDHGPVFIEDDSYEGPDEPVEKAISFLPFSYGSMQTIKVRCFPDPATWAGKCFVPINKQIEFSNNVSAGTFLGVNFNEQAKQAINDMKNMGASLGWTLAIVAGKPDQIKLGVPGGSALAETLMTHSSANDEAFGGGVVAKVHKCEIVLSTTAWSGQNGWSSFSTFQKSRFVRNAIKHEIGHCMGLGHHNNSSSLMNPTPISQYPDVILLPIAGDQTMLAEYAP
jgi:hypothetical protein